MSQGTVTYTGIQIAKGAEYTQTRGIRPDSLAFDVIPQTTAIPSIGNIVLGYGADSLVIPHCLADKSQITLNENGFTGTIVFQDRRWRWSRYPAVSYHWNERDVTGTIVTATQKSLRAMVLQLCTDIDEATAIVTALPADFYPELDVLCERPDLVLDKLLQMHGFDIALGFGSEPITIVEVGVGLALPTAQLMAASTGVDPPTNPQYVRICYGPSVAQARFKLIALGRDTDGTLKELDSLSYAPSAGWDQEPPHFPNVYAQHGQDDWILAMTSVYRYYAVNKFAPDTLELPDGSATLASIAPVLPLLPTLLTTEVYLSRPQYERPKVYGIYFKDKHPNKGNTAIDEEVEEPFQFDRYRGMVIFSEAMFRQGGVDDPILPADLYLEAAFRLRSATNFQFVAYHKDVQVDPFGAGYHNVRLEDAFAQTIAQYDNTHTVTGTTTNETELDTLAAAAVAAAEGEYLYKSRSIGYYNRPMFNIRLDGLISQVKHVISDGTTDIGNYTVAAHSMEFDRFIRTANDRRMLIEYIEESRRAIPRQVTRGRAAKGNE